MKLGIISAMSSEQEQLSQRLEEKKEVQNGHYKYILGRIGKNQIILTQSGIGKVNAAIGVAEMIREFKPDCVISTGVAGGIDACLQVADVVASSKTVYHDVWCGDGNAYGQIQGQPLFFEANSTLTKIAAELNGKDIKSHVHIGLICTGDQFISNQDELSTIKKNFPEGLAVDMESCAIAHTCSLYKTPFISFRIISDTPGRHEDNFGQYLDFWKTMADRSFQTTWTYLTSLPEKL